MQVSNGSLLQFADDTCLICSADSPNKEAAMLQDDKNALFHWISVSKMKLNLSQSSIMIMWLSIKPSPTEAPTIVINNAALSVVCKQRYLGVIFDSQLKWTHQVASVCKSMSYYLMISSHAKTLPSSVIKILIESFVLSHYSYALPVWSSPSYRFLVLPKIVTQL